MKLGQLSLFHFIPNHKFKISFKLEFLTIEEVYTQVIVYLKYTTFLFFSLYIYKNENHIIDLSVNRFVISYDSWLSL